MSNKFSGTCQRCGLHVQRGEGRAIRQGSRWVVEHEPELDCDSRWVIELPTLAPAGQFEVARQALASADAAGRAETGEWLIVTDRLIVTDYDDESSPVRGVLLARLATPAEAEREEAIAWEMEQQARWIERVEEARHMVHGAQVNRYDGAGAVLERAYREGWVMYCIERETCWGQEERGSYAWIDELRDLVWIDDFSVFDEVEDDCAGRMMHAIRLTPEIREAIELADGVVSLAETW